MEKRPKMKIQCKYRYFEKFFRCQSIENCAKTNVLHQLDGEKRVHVFDGKYCKNTVKDNVLEGFPVYMFELASSIGTWKN